MPIQTLTELFLVAADYDKPDCLLHKVGSEFQPISTRKLVESVRKLSSVLATLGIERGDRVALMAENGPHWPMIDFATLCHGGVLVPIYPTLTPDQAAYVLPMTAVPGCSSSRAGTASKACSASARRCPMSSMSCSSVTTARRPGYRPSRGCSSRPSRRTRRPSGRPRMPPAPTTWPPSSTPAAPPASPRASCSATATSLPMWSTACSASRSRWAGPPCRSCPSPTPSRGTVDYVYFHQGVTIAYAESVQAVASEPAGGSPHMFLCRCRGFTRRSWPGSERMSRRARPPSRRSSTGPRELAAMPCPTGWRESPREALWGSSWLWPIKPGLRQAAGASRRSIPVRHLGWCSPAARPCRVLLGRRDRDLRGLRPL